VVGRAARQGMALLEYVVPVYATAAALLAAMAMISGVPFTGFRLGTYVFLILLALLPQCLGHTACNWSLKYLTATVVAVLALAEPVTASALAYWILSEPLPAMVVAGGAAVGTGILLVARWGSGRSEETDKE
ncbi:MAG: DMT family transporter, partial [Acidobacteriota bacterium]